MASTVISPTSFPLVPAEPAAYGNRAHSGDDDEHSPALNAPGSDHRGSERTSHIHSHSNGKDDDEKWIWVLDPMTRKLRVPVHLLNPTQAIATSGTVPSLCIAYLEGRCRHPWCRQAHVLPSAIPQLRYEALNAPTCCHLHNDPHDISKLTARFRYIRIVNNGPCGNSELIPTERVASTVGLLRYLVHNVLPKKQEEAARKEKASGAATTTTSTTTVAATDTATTAAAASTNNSTTPVDDDDVLELPAKFICRLHLAHRCRYLEDCNNIHLCRECELQLQPPPHMLGSLSGVTTSTRTVTVGDACYTVTPLAVGEVSDEDFRAISEAQKALLQQADAASPGPGVLPWAAQNPFDSAVPNSTRSSPMLYSHGGAMTPLSGPANGSGTLFPAVPDYWQPPSALGSAMPGSSPCLLSTTIGGSAVDRSTTNSHAAGGSGGHLRAYDVRPKKSSTGSGNVAVAAAATSATTTTTTTTTATNAVSSSANNSITTYAPSVAAFAAKDAASGAQAGTATITITVSSSSPSKPGTPDLSGGPSGCSNRGNMISTSVKAVGSQSNSHHNITSGTSTNRKAGAIVGSSSTEGGASISSSGANTPVSDGVFAVFLKRTS